MSVDTSTAPPEAARDAEPAGRLRELEVLRDLAVACMESVEAPEVFALVCGAFTRLLSSDFALLALPALEVPCEWCAGPEPPREAFARLVEVLERARQTGETMVAGNATAEVAAELGPRVLPAPYGAATALAFPLESRGDGGALLVGWRGARELDAATLRLAREISALAAKAFRNTIRHQGMAQTAANRERFFSAMSHDLRTPITAIMGYSELLQDGIMGDLEPHQHDMVERICQVSGHLAELVNDVLDIAKLDAGRMEFHREPVTLGELVTEALPAVEPQAHAKGLELRNRVGDHANARLLLDTSRVRQVLVNLLANAVKFTEQGNVTLSAHVGDGQLRLLVSDTGPGLPEGGEKTVFEEFLQIASGTKAKREPGSGLGLAIARKLVEAMGGKLSAQNGDEGGAVFTLLLPLDLPDA